MRPSCRATSVSGTAAKGTVENAIMGHEMGVWLAAIRDTKASVWITFDSCHSGTMMRGGDGKEVTRDIDPQKELGIPKKAIDEAQEKARKRRGGQAGAGARWSARRRVTAGQSERHRRHLRRPEQRGDAGARDATR